MNTAGMKRLAIATLTFACAFMASSMPTKDELVQAQKLVEDLTADDVRALNAGTKKPVEVAAAQLALADEAETEAGKYLLLQGAFKLYARSADYDAAADVLVRMRKEIADLPPEVVVELVNSEMRRVAAEKAPKVLSIFRDAQRTIKCRKELDAAESAAKARPGNAAAQRRLAECHAGLGDWAKALEVFAKIGDEAAKYELDPASAKGYDALKAANYWWEYQAKDDEPFKVHAAVLYRKGLADGSISGLRKTLAEKRVKQMESVLPAEGEAAIETSSGLASNALYCVIDLSAGPSASRYPVKWYAEPPPGGFNTDEYKTTKLVLRRIDPGTFTMGESQLYAARNVTVHKVTLTKKFWLGMFETTQKQWECVMGSNPSKFKGDDRPVESVTWDECQVFVKRVNEKLGGDMMRLPTEAEWEYACRAGTTGDFGGTGKIDDMGWCGVNNSSGETHPVGQKQANAWSLYDMHGNVEEFCSDWFEICQDGAVVDPQGPSSGRFRVVRGGEHGGKVVDCRSAKRWRVLPNEGRGRGWIGCRLCMSADREAPSGRGVSRGSGAPAASDGGAAEQPPAKLAASAPAVNGKAISVKLAPGVMLDFVPCPAGSFEMGCDDDEKSPQFKHKVTITRPFWIGKYQVTRAVWAVYEQRETKVRQYFGQDINKFGGLSVAKSIYPSNTHADILKFCDWLNHFRKSVLPNGYVFRLPTEAEWEYALNANGGKPGNPYVKWRDGDKSIAAEIMVVKEDYIKILGDPSQWSLGGNPTLPAITVGTKSPNDWGIYDMLSNGREFVLDTFDGLCADEKIGDGLRPTSGMIPYMKDEVDPVRICSNSMKACALIRGGHRNLPFEGEWYGKFLKKTKSRFQGKVTTFRLVIGPDLLKERGIK